MEELQEKSCCFIGHRKIEQSVQLERYVKDLVENLITKEKVQKFYFGSKSEFNSMCYDIVSELKLKYEYIKRVYCRSSFEYISDSYKEFLLSNYEETYFPEKCHKAGKLAYIKRNEEMINKSVICVFYCNQNCKIEKIKSGTIIAYEYAKRKNKVIINVCEKLH